MVNINKRYSLSRTYHSVISPRYVLAIAAIVGGGLATSAAAQAPQPQEYRVGNLIESGNFSDPKGWTLTGLRVDKGTGLTTKGVKAGAGTATTTFQGPDGLYDIRIRYLDAASGTAQASLSVGGKAVGRWNFDSILINTERWKEFTGIQISNGDEIVLSGKKGGKEDSRITGIEILPSQRKTPLPDAAEIEKKEYSLNLVPVRDHLPVQKASEYLVEPVPLFTGGAGTHWVYLKKGEPFRLTVWPSRGGDNPSLQYSLTKVGADKPVAEETLVSEGPVPIFIVVRDAEEGVYELNASTAPDDKSGIRLDFDAPGVTNEGRGEGYFFVPKGTKAFSVKTINHLVLMDAAGQVMLDGWFDKNATAVVGVPAGSDGQIWHFQGSMQEVAGVPPYFAARPEAVLAPVELLK